MGMRWGEGLKTMGNVIGNMAQQSRLDRQRLEDQAREDKYRADMMGLQQDEMALARQQFEATSRRADEAQNLDKTQILLGFLDPEQDITQAQYDAYSEQTGGAIDPFLQMAQPAQPTRPDPQAPYGPYVGGQTPYGTERATAQAMLPATGALYRPGVSAAERIQQQQFAHERDQIGLRGEEDRKTKLWERNLPLSKRDQADLEIARKSLRLDERGYDLQRDQFGLRRAAHELDKLKWDSTEEQNQAYSALQFSERASTDRNKYYDSVTAFTGFTGIDDLPSGVKEELIRLDQAAENARTHAFNMVNKFTGNIMGTPETLAPSNGAATEKPVVNVFDEPTPPATNGDTSTTTPQKLIPPPEWHGSMLDFGYTWDPVKGVFVGYGLDDLAADVAKTKIGGNLALAGRRLLEVPYRAMNPGSTWSERAQ